ncbi:hypothetical protein COT42_00470 [Candidatus Saganbacteria bacterium CG08_land_8_20_14_0_20_45_16]|uniref:DNA methylase adenine-specific domain-containing protein n=1 Tax=Candidatus Saganbacteria bacterium CG08_land_8_20_14_0_20_45_16 TaxID=2014293 RepID=A0A2H0Y1T8_UNCSA|nr:MAG: hypothetical protein COT42_00470 [Candidatus Saganbacteria bacterium CG08_land_8_20_14_0_20_45_16]
MYSTQIPACLWFVSRDRHDGILFVDARKMGEMVTRRNRELTEADLKQSFKESRKLKRRYLPI